MVCGKRNWPLVESKQKEILNLKNKVLKLEESYIKQEKNKQDASGTLLLMEKHKNAISYHEMYLEKIFYSIENTVQRLILKIEGFHYLFFWVFSFFIGMVNLFKKRRLQRRVSQIT